MMHINLRSWAAYLEKEGLSDAVLLFDISTAQKAGGLGLFGRALGYAVASRIWVACWAEGYEHTECHLLPAEAFSLRVEPLHSLPRRLLDFFQRPAGAAWSMPTGMRAMRWWRQLFREGAPGLLRELSQWVSAPE